ncbi:MAG: hypothetical protein JWM65_3147 [Sphingomonas bacterium]|nr:hypothetical protein [Sphingomonas bacterium]
MEGDFTDGSVISGNMTGVVAKAPVSIGTIKLMISRATIDENSGYGISVNGIGTTGRVGETVISNNGTGVLTGASAVLSSFGNNMLNGNGNGTDGAFSGTVIPLK